MGEYDPAYYESFRSSARTSAEVIVPMLMKWTAPRSVIDLGCGLGVWLSVFQDSGVNRICGVDGAHVEKDMLEIPAENFIEHDLEEPFEGGEKYDLAMSVEVAEHLSEDAAAPLVESLVRLAPVVLFSASIPYQSGRHHVNCQPPRYWARLFEGHGYVAIDCLRARLWEDSRVDWWYRQNIMVYADGEQLNRWPRLEAMRQAASGPLHLVHPDCFQEWVTWGLSQAKLYWDLKLGKGEETGESVDEDEGS